MKKETINNKSSLFCSGRYFVGDLLMLLKNVKDVQNEIFCPNKQKNISDKIEEINIYGKLNKAFFCNVEMDNTESFFSVSNVNNCSFKTTTGVIGIIELKDNAVLYDMCQEAVSNGLGQVITIKGDFEPKPLHSGFFRFGMHVVEKII